MKDISTTQEELGRFDANFENISRAAYMSVFFEIANTQCSYKDAYLETETKYRKAFGTKKYKNYASFRVAKYKYLETIF